MNPDTSPKLIRWTTATATLASLVLLSSQAGAQVAPSTDQAAARPASDEVITLSPFDVNASKDKGYRSTATASVTRLAADLYDLPVSAQIINSEILNDFGIRNYYDAIKFIAGGLYQGASTPNQQSQVQLRGIPSTVPDDLQRDGYRIAGGVNNFNVDRIEVLRGPNSVVQGATDPGGQVNVITKSAVPGRKFLNVAVAAGNYGLFRSSIDTNVSGTIGKAQVAARVNAVVDNKDSFIKFVGDDQTGLALAVKAQLPTRTDLELKVEHLERDGTPPSAVPDRWTGKAGWRGGFHLGLNRTVPKLYNYDEAEATVGPDGFDLWDQKYLVASLTQQIGKDMTFRAEFQTAPEDQQYQVPNNANPGIGYNAATDSYFIRTVWGWTRSDQERYNLRAYLNYNLDLGWTKQSLIAGASRLEVELTTTNDVLWDGATNTQVVYLAPLSPGKVDAQNYAMPRASSYFWKASSAAKSKVVNPTYYVNSTGTYLDGRLTTLLGVSFNTSTRDDYVLGPVTGNGNFRDGTTAVPAITGTQRAKFSPVCPMYGVMYKLSPSWHLYAGYSESYKPQTAYLPTLDINTGAIGGSLAPTDGIGHEFGVKFDLFEGKVSGSIAAYEVESTNTAVTVDLDIIARLLGANVTQRYFVEGVNIGGTGVDFELFYNPTRHTTMFVNYNYNDISVIASPAAPAIKGLPANNGSHHIFAAQAKHDFFDSSSQGWYVGGNVFYRSASYYYLNGTPQKGWSPAYRTYGVFGGYSGKFGDRRYTIQANIDNLFDKEYELAYAKMGQPRTYFVELSLKL